MVMLQVLSCRHDGPGDSVPKLCWSASGAAAASFRLGVKTPHFLYPSGARKTHQQKVEPSRPGMSDPVQRLPDMDEEGIDVAIIFGTPIALTVNGLQDKGLAAALCHGVNRWLVEYCAPEPKRLKGVGLIPCQDPTVAARELA